MEINITTFFNPFSFFCKVEDDNHEKDLGFTETSTVHRSKTEVSDMNHGQYVAVMWKNKWARGIVTMETQFLIWLVDYGMFLKPDEKTVYIDLPMEYRKLPTKVFEASIHGVSPVDKILTEDCQIGNKIATSWNNGSLEKARALIECAAKILFVPVALLSTKNNDVVLGHLYLKIPGKGLVDIVNELQAWPVFLEKNKESYIENMPIYYTSRRKHRACLLKPIFSDYVVPDINLALTMAEYNAICENAPLLKLSTECSIVTGDGSTCTGFEEGVLDKKDNIHKTVYKLTSEEIEKYSGMYVNVHGREYNVLNVLLNKIKDLNICERYKDHDLKRVGRANTRNPSH